VRRRRANPTGTTSSSCNTNADQRRQSTAVTNGRPRVPVTPCRTPSPPRPKCRTSASNRVRRRGCEPGARPGGRHRHSRGAQIQPAVPNRPRPSNLGTPLRPGGRQRQRRNTAANSLHSCRVDQAASHHASHGRQSSHAPTICGTVAGDLRHIYRTEPSCNACGMHGGRSQQHQPRTRTRDRGGSEPSRPTGPTRDVDAKTTATDPSKWHVRGRCCIKPSHALGAVDSPSERLEAGGKATRNRSVASPIRMRLPRSWITNWSARFRSCGKSCGSGS
jgi:hypothetical protein